MHQRFPVQERPASIADAEVVFPAVDPVIWIDSGRMSGAPCFIHTRVPVQVLWDYVEGGEAIGDFLEGFEGITFEQCVRVLKMGREALMQGLPKP